MPKIFLRHCFSENNMGGWLLISFFNVFAYKNDVSMKFF